MLLESNLEQIQNKKYTELTHTQGHRARHRQVVL